MERLPADVSERIVVTVMRWAESGHGDLAVLRNYPGATHRLRVGDWRVLLVLDSAQHTAQVRSIAPRGFGYKP
jgi:mRNA-degrading endonuclease RelE of RelBE toxin-antitoxin system